MANDVIAIVTHPSYEGWLDNLLQTISTDIKYPLIIVINEAKKASKEYLKKLSKYNLLLIEENRFEPGALEKLLVCTPYNRFLFLQDTDEIKDSSIFDDIFQIPQSCSIYPRYACFLGTYKRDILEKLDFPIVTNKEEEIDSERTLNQAYMALALEKNDLVSYWQPLVDTFDFEYKFGRVNMVSQNDYIIKYRGTWSFHQKLALMFLEGDFSGLDLEKIATENYMHFIIHNDQIIHTNYRLLQLSP